MPFCFVRRRSVGAAESLGASQIEIFPRDRYPACNNPASYARYPFNHPISSHSPTSLTFFLSIQSLNSMSPALLNVNNSPGLGSEGIRTTINVSD